MDELIQKASDAIRNGSSLFQNNRTFQYGVLGGFLVLWLLFSGSLFQTLLAALGMGLGWLVGRKQTNLPGE